MNRQQRRAAERENRRNASEQAAYIIRREEARNAKKAKLERNGITIADLEKATNEGFEKGYQIASADTIKACYAAMCLALKEIHGFKKKRCRRVLQAVDQIILYRLTGDDLIEQVWREIGLQLNFNEPLDRLEEVS